MCAEQYKETQRLTTYQVDQNRIARASGLWQLMQEAASHQMKTQKPSYDELLNEGKALMLARVDLVIPEEIYFDEEVEASSWPCPSSRATFLRNYMLSRPEAEDSCGICGTCNVCGNEEANCGADDKPDSADEHKKEKMLAIAATQWSLVDIESRKILKVSEVDFSNYWMGDYIELIPHKFKIAAEDIEKMQSAGPVGHKVVAYGDLDYNGHMNNTYYLDMICDYIPELAAGTHRVSGMRIHYSKEAPLGEHIAIYCLEKELSEKEVAAFESNNVPAEKKYVFRTLNMGKACDDACGCMGDQQTAGTETLVSEQQAASASGKDAGELNIEAEIIITPRKDA